MREQCGDLRRVRIAVLEQDERALVGRERAIVLTAVAAHPRDEVEGLHRLIGLMKLLVQLERLLGETERLDVGVDRGRSLRCLPRVLDGLVGDVPQEVVVGKGWIELA